MTRDYRYFPEAGVTFGVDAVDGIAKISVVTCSDADTFSRETGRQLIDLLFDGTDGTLKVLNLKRNVFAFPYSGEKTRNEVLVPLVESLSDILEDRALFRCLKVGYKAGVQTLKDAYEFSEASGLKCVAEAYDILDDEDRKLLRSIESEEELDRVFFDWGISANAVIDKVRKFAAARRKESYQVQKVVKGPMGRNVVVNK